MNFFNHYLYTTFDKEIKLKIKNLCDIVRIMSIILYVYSLRAFKFHVFTLKKVRFTTKKIICFL